MDIKLADNSTLKLPATQEAAASYVADMFMNRGRLPEQDGAVEWRNFYDSVLSPKMKDAVNTTEIRPLLEHAMEIMIREPVEPLMVITSLFNRVASRGLSHQIVAGAMGAVYAQEIAEGQPYPEVNFNIGGGVQTAWIGKAGIGAAFSDEALRYSTWDIMAMNLRLMAQAMTRLKEQKAITYLKSLGTVYFDNAVPSDSLFGVTTGRALDMTANGTLIMDDIFKAIAHSSEEGFPFDTMVMSPLFFFKFCQDPVMREMMLAHGGGAYFRQWNGNPGPRDPWTNGAIGSQGPTSGFKLVPGGTASGETPSGVLARSNTANSSFPMPSYMPWNFNIVISPLMPFDPETQTGDIFLLSSGNVGLYLVDEELTQVEWRDETNETVKVKLRERYGFAVSYEGQGVGLIKNVKAGRNYWDGTTKAVVNDAVEEIDPSTPIDL